MTSGGDAGGGVAEQSQVTARHAARDSADRIYQGALRCAYGWWKVSQITHIAAIASFALAGLTLIGSAFGLAAGPGPVLRPCPTPGQVPVKVA